MHERWLDQAPLVMTLLRPGVGKENVDAGKRPGRDHVLHDFDRIVLHDAHVSELALADQLEQAPHARRMHFDAEIIVLGMRLRDCRGSLAHAESDLEHRRCAPSKGAFHVERLWREGDCVLRQQLVVRTLLRDRHAALAQHVAANSPAALGAWLIAIGVVHAREARRAYAARAQTTTVRPPCSEWTRWSRW